MKKRERKKAFIFWKWTLGEPYYKSAVKERATNVNPNATNNSEYDSQQNAIKQSLDFDFDIQPQGFTSVNIREELDDKMSGRELVQQRGANPFMQQTSYVNDIVVRDMYLKPANTTQGRYKNSESAAIESEY
jgi:hypothetical protein